MARHTIAGNLVGQTIGTCFIQGLDVPQRNRFWIWRLAYQSVDGQQNGIWHSGSVWKLMDQIANDTGGCMRHVTGHMEEIFVVVIRLVVSL